MSFLAPTLKERITIQGVSDLDSSSDTGLLINLYTDIKTIWANLKPLSDYIKAIRGQNTNNAETHIFTVRNSAINSIGAQFSSAFTYAYKSIPDFHPLKSEYFIFLKKGSSIRGRRFKISGTQPDEENQEFVKIKAIELEDIGIGNRS